MAIVLNMPLVDDLSLTTGTGPATFTRSTAGTYISTVDGLLTTAAIDTARFETNGVLIEDASNNGLIRSEEFDNGSWSVADATVTADQAMAPDGLTTADEVDISGGANGRISQICGEGAGTFTYSIYLRALSGQSGTYPLRVITQGTGGSTVDQNVTIDDSAWVRAEVVVTQTGAGNIIVYAGHNGVAGNTLEVTFAWGAQIEESPFATSYIPTTTIEVTRGADNLTIPSSNIPVPTLDYSVSATVNVIGDISTDEQGVYSVTGETFRYIRTEPGLGAMLTGHGTEISDTTAITPNTPIDVVQTLDVSDSSTGQKIYRDEVLLVSGAVTAVTGTKTAIEIGKRGSVEYLFGHIKDFKIYDEAIIPGAPSGGGGSNPNDFICGIAGLTAIAVPDKWQEYLTGKGFPYGSFNDSQYDWLGTNGGYTGSLTDRTATWSKAGFPDL